MAASSRCRTSDAVANGQYGADFLAAADFNRDGKLDLAVASGSGSLFRVLPGNGDGTFSGATSSAGFTTLAVGDFDNDGNTDVAGTISRECRRGNPVEPVGAVQVAEGGSLDSTAANSTDIDGNIVAYEWDLDGDGDFGETGAEATRGDETGMYPTFSAAGLDGPSTWTVHVRVTDAGGLSSEDTEVIQITNPPHR